MKKLPGARRDFDRRFAVLAFPESTAKQHSFVEATKAWFIRDFGILAEQRALGGDLIPNT